MSSNISDIRGRGCVAGLFTTDPQAERALDELKQAGFTDQQIGVATAGASKSGEHSGFWYKVSNLFGKKDHLERSETVQGSLTGCGLDADTARYFDDSLREGSVLLTVVTDGGGQVNLARDILERCGGDIGKQVSARVPETAAMGGDRAIELRGEVLRTQKERVPAGEVRLRKEVISENQHIEVPVSREELVIERNPVSGREAAADIGAGEKEVRVPLSEEQVHVEKKPVVNEEVRLRKEQVAGTKRVDETLRHEELRTEREGDIGVRGDIAEKDKNKRVA